MLTPLVVVAFLAGQPASPALGLDVMSNHATRALEEGAYLHVVVSPFRARVQRTPSANVLEIDVVRFGPADGAREGAAAILVELSGQSSTIPVRAPLDPSRKAGDGLMASYPVRHRFPLPEGVSDVVVTVVQGASGVGLSLRTMGDEASDLPPLVPLEPAPLDVTGTDAAAGDPSAPGVDAAAVASPADPARDDGGASPPSAEGSAGVDAAAASGDAPAQVSRGLKLPARFSAQVGVGGMWQLSGGLAPALLSGGVRVVTGVREGWLSRYAFGAALDFEHQSARSSGSDVLQARWDATATRLRLEAQAGVLAIDLGFAPLDVTVLGGAGMIIGAHTFDVNGAGHSALLLGPSLRVGAQAGLGLGPGAVVALVPVDVSFDVVGGRVHGFAPLATSLYLGYRLDL